MDTNYNPAAEAELARETERQFRMAAPSSRPAVTREERQMNRFTFRVLLPLVLLIVGAILGSLGAHAIMAQQAADADWTVPACSVYADTAHPDLPPYTRTDVCYTENSDGGYTISTGDHQWTAAY